MKTEKIKIDKIFNNPDNPRVIKDEKFEKLVKSIKEFPKMLEIRPIVVNNEMMILGGNMRLKACIEAGLKEVHIMKADDLTPEQQKEFIIKDNVNFGEWDWAEVGKEWEDSPLEEWGLDGWEDSEEEISIDDLDGDGDDFDLPEGDKSPFQQMSITLSDDQATLVKNAIEDIKQMEEFKYVETFGNENSNGNALYFLITEYNRLKSE